MLAWFHHAIANKSPPTAPQNLTALAISESEISLSWDSAPDDQQVLFYEIRRNGTVVASPEVRFFIDSNLQAGTYYDYDILASDGVNLSKAAGFRLRTQQLISASTPEKPSGDDAGVAFRPQIVASITVSQQELPPTNWQLVFNDDFDGNGTVDVTSQDRNWRFETMDDGLHRAGNSGIDADGNIINQFNSVRGKRWSGWYNQLNDQNAYRDDGILVLKGTDSGEPDPTRPTDYMDNGVATMYGSSKLYTAWLDTFSRVYDNTVMGHIVDPASPGKAFKYGYIEARVSFERIKTPGFRLSIWLLPATADEAGQQLVVDRAYDADGNNGVEIDIFEYEWTNQANASRIQMALIGGAAGNEHFNVHTTDLTPSVDVSEGFHTIGLLWLEDTLDWYLNGTRVFAVTDPDLIPDVFSYPIISREMNSGVKRNTGNNSDVTDVFEQPPFIPQDAGLYANNIWEYRDRLATDEALVDYFRIWQP